jgi:hypothetical protein
MKSLESRIDQFELHFCKRMLGVARRLGESFANDCDGDELAESGFIILSIGLMYFEPIAMFMDGEESKGRSPHFFKRGFRSVYSASNVSNEDVDLLWDSSRNGMFHCGMTKLRCHLSRLPATTFTKDGNVMIINPSLLISDISRHFAEYCTALRNIANDTLRESFNRMYSHFEGLASVSSLTKTPTTPEPCSSSFVSDCN